MWPIEAADLVAVGRSLTELVAVGPFIGRQIDEWLREPPVVSERRRSAPDSSATPKPANHLGHPEWESGLRSDLQMHTTYTDGGGTIAEMVEGAAPLGYAYPALTDHSQQLKIHRDERIARWRRGHGRGLPRRPRHRARRVPWPAAEEGRPDRALLQGPANRTVDVHAHPRGRIWNFRLGLVADWQRVVERATELDKALEIDAYPDPHDLNVELLRHTAETGCRISIGTDAHTSGELYVIWIGVAAILAGLKREQILNYMTVGELRAWVRRRRTA